MAEVPNPNRVLKMPFDAAEQHCTLDQWLDRLAAMGGHKVPTKAVQPRKVRRGELYQIGAHRLMCGDCTDEKDVKKLMDGQSASLCFTSPPYVDQRTYVHGAPPCFTTLMNNLCKNIPLKEDGQLLVNLGQVIQDGEIYEYERPWIEWMKTNNWKLYDKYIWAKQNGIPFRNERLVRTHEEILHFSRIRRRPAKTVPVVSEYQPTITVYRTVRRKDGSFRHCQPIIDAPAPTHKKHGTVFHVSSYKDKDRRKFHPAVFPLELCLEILPIWSDKADIVFEPFSGSGTTILACEELGRKCYAMEIEPEYVEQSLKHLEEKLGVKAMTI